MPRELSRVAGRHRVQLRVELLEDRSVPSVFAPSQIRHAYGFDQITFANGSIVGNGAGQTIAIVDAYDDPFIFSDLHRFDQTFGLPDPPVFTKAMQYGTRPDAGWAGEIALDVEWAHAIAPGANILLVEAKSNNLSDLLAAVDYAASRPGVSVVSMSWGTNEFSSERAIDSHFVTPAGHRGVTFVASAGDDGAPPGWPAISPNVLSVGGTTLRLTSTGNYWSETGWSESGGGVSRYESIPGYQTFVNTGSATRRTNPDVAYNADPNTGVYVYDSFNGGWFAVGGTSAGAPQWAALVAIANEGRILAGKGSLDGASQTMFALYRMAQASATSYFRDQTSGYNGFAAKVGYDDVTGNGSPIARRVVTALVGWNGTGATGIVAAATSTATKRPAGSATRHAIVSAASAPTPELPVPQSSIPAFQPMPALVLVPVTPSASNDAINPFENGAGPRSVAPPPQFPLFALVEPAELRRVANPDPPTTPSDDVPFDWGWPIGPAKSSPSDVAKPTTGGSEPNDPGDETSTEPPAIDTATDSGNDV
jgi:subtilase family serine protease